MLVLGALAAVAANTAFDDLGKVNGATRHPVSTGTIDYRAEQLKRGGRRVEAYAYRDFVQLAGDEIDDRIAGLTAGSSAQNLFSAVNDTTHVYTRSSTWFGHDLDISFAPVYISNGATTFGALVSPRHIIFAQHATPSNGVTLYFAGTDGVTVSRTLTSSTQVGSTDIQVGILSSDLPSTVSYARVLTAQQEALIADNISPVSAAGLLIDQNRKAYLAETYSGSTGLVTFHQPGSSPRSTFWKSGGIISGDSGHAMGVILDGQFIFLANIHSALSTTGCSGDSVAQNYAAVNSVMTSLGGGYQLTPYRKGRGLIVNDGTRTIHAGDVPALNSSLVIPGALLDLNFIPNQTYALADSDSGTSVISCDGTGPGLLFDNFSSVTFNSGTDTILRTALATGHKVTPPANASSTGTTGDWAQDTGFIYICTATNTWKRVAIATW